MLTILFFLTQAYIKMKEKRGPRPLVLFGPTGSDESDLIKKLFDEFPETFGLAIKHTTRKPYLGEENGVHHHFVDKEDMKKAIARNEFWETSEFDGNIIGTSKKAVCAVQNLGKVCVLDFDIDGVKRIRDSNLHPMLVFVMPRSIEKLRESGQNSETLESEITYGTTPGNFHATLKGELSEAYKELRAYVLKELYKQQAQGININLQMQQ